MQAIATTSGPYARPVFAVLHRRSWRGFFLRKHTMISHGTHCRFPVAAPHRILADTAPQYDTTNATKSAPPVLMMRVPAYSEEVSGSGNTMLVGLDDIGFVFAGGVVVGLAVALAVFVAAVAL